MPEAIHTAIDLYQIKQSLGKRGKSKLDYSYYHPDSALPKSRTMLWTGTIPMAMETRAKDWQTLVGTPPNLKLHLKMCCLKNHNTSQSSIIADRVEIVEIIEILKRGKLANNQRGR